MDELTWREIAIRHQMALEELGHAYREMAQGTIFDPATENYMVPFTLWYRLATAWETGSDMLDPAKFEVSESGDVA